MFSFARENKKIIAIKSLDVIDKISKLMISSEDEQKEIHVLNQLVEEFSKKNGKTRTFLVLLQNNMELRPGGGFLGQYAIIKIKDGELVSTFIEDANLLDQRISVRITPPYPFKRMMQIKNWKFRDSNFSPDFPTNVEKAKYFFRLSGGNSVQFDGVIAVNATVLNDILALTGPITVPGYPETFTSENAVLKLEEKVEKAYIMNPEIDTQNRKAIMKKMAPIIFDKLFTLGNISKIANLAHAEMQKKNIMLYFSDPNLEKLAESVYWSGKMAADWSGDYLMAVDANMGAFKTDYYIKREMEYEINFTGEKPIVTLRIKYKNTAAYGDWRTSDYHSYLRIYVPEGSKFLEREMISSPLTNSEFRKTYFGSIVHVLIGGETNAMIKYELPESITLENYRLLIQKQSGTGDIPVRVRIIKPDGQVEQQGVLNKDLKFELK